MYMKSIFFRVIKSTRIHGFADAELPNEIVATTAMYVITIISELHHHIYQPDGKIVLLLRQNNIDPS